MKCPDCQSGLRATEMGEVEIDHCRACGGTWFDEGELQRVREAVGPSSDGAPKFKPTDGPGGPCPRCVGARLAGGVVARLRWAAARAARASGCATPKNVRARPTGSARRSRSSPPCWSASLSGRDRRLRGAALHRAGGRGRRRGGPPAGRDRGRRARGPARRRVAVDGTFTPDWEEAEAPRRDLSRYLEEARARKKDRYSREKLGRIEEARDRYVWHCGGYTKAKERFLFCTFVSGWPEAANRKEFPGIKDGGTSVCRCTFRIKTGKIETLEWNGEA